MSKFNRYLLILALGISVLGLCYKFYDMLIDEGKPALLGVDDSMYFFWLRSVVIDHDLDFQNDIAQCETISREVKVQLLNGTKTELGYIPNKYWIGWALVNSVIYYPTHLIYGLFTDEQPTGYEAPYLISIWSFQILLGALSLYCAFRILRYFFSKENALSAVLVVWLASPLVYYQVARVSMAHNQVFFLTLFLFYTCFGIMDGNTRWWNWTLMGLLSALLVLTRSTAVVYLTFPLWVFIQASRPGTIRQILGRLACSVLPALIPILIQLIAWKQLYGSYIVYSYSGESFDFLSPTIVDVLFSNDHGLFNWHPLLLVGFLAFVISIWKYGLKLAIPWISSSALIIYINAAWWDSSFASSFGNRGFESMVFFCMFGTAALLQFCANHNKLKICQVTAIVFVIWNLQLLLGFFIQSYPRDEAVSYKDRVLLLSDIKQLSQYRIPSKNQ